MDNGEELATMIQAQCKEMGEIVYVKADDEGDLQDFTKKTRRKGRVSLTKENVLFRDEENRAFMTLELRNISKILEPGKKFLCLEYGPKRKPMFILLDFTNEPSGCLEEWEEALCNMMGMASHRPRAKTETNMHKPNQNPLPKRAQSAYLQTTPVGSSHIQLTEKQTSVESPQTPDDVFVAPFPVTSSGEDLESPGGASTGSDVSPFHSLQSTCSIDRSPEELDCSKQCLNQHEFKDHEGKIFVNKTVHGSKLHVGDVIIVYKKPDTAMSATELRKFIRETQDETIKIYIQRGVEITVKEGEMELSINITGSKAARPNTEDVLKKICNNESGFSITEINGKPVAVGTQTDEVTEELVKEALQQNLHEHCFHLVPQSFLKVAELATNDANPDKNNNIKDDANVQEARPLDVGDNPHASDYAADNDGGETEC